MDGILIINKPIGYTSHDIVNIARKVLKTRKIGHIGTLDPNATGVLVLFINRATKLVKYFENHNKTYIATIRLGIQTDTDDITGTVIEKEDPSIITDDMIKDVLKTFVGKQKQMPPIYSAIKINGKKLYELARKNIEIKDIKSRDIEIYSITEFHKTDESAFKIKLEVSKGTYIRSIARDLGKKLEVFGTLEALERTSIEKFKIEDSYSLEDLKNSSYKFKNPFDYLNMPKITVNKEYEIHVKNGRILDASLFKQLTDTIILSNDKSILAIYRYDSGRKIMRMSVKWC